MKRRSWQMELPHMGECPGTNICAGTQDLQADGLLRGVRDLTRSMRPERPWFFWFHCPWRPAGGVARCTARVGDSGNELQFLVGHHHGQFDDAVAIGG